MEKNIVIMESAPKAGVDSIKCSFYEIIILLPRLEHFSYSLISGSKDDVVFLTEHWLVVQYHRRGKFFGNAFRKSLAGKVSYEAVQVFAKSAEMPISTGIP
jgi:hypothetical protein